MTAPNRIRRIGPADDGGSGVEPFAITYRFDEDSDAAIQAETTRLAVMEQAAAIVREQRIAAMNAERDAERWKVGGILLYNDSFLRQGI